VTQALTSAPKKGLTFVALQCGFPQCKTNSEGIKAATDALGWKLKVLDFDSANPATLISAMKQALQYHPVAVSLNGLPPATWQSEVPAYEKAGVPIFPIDIGPAAPVSKTIPINIGNGDGQGKAVAAWFTQDSAGSGKGLLVDIPDFPVLKQIADNISSGVQQYCSGCSLTDLNVTIAQQESNAIVPAIVSSMQRNPDVKYILLADGVIAPGLPAALKAAGIDGVKIAGGLGSSENMSDVKNGTEQAFTSENLIYDGLVAVDAAARQSENMTISPASGVTPIQLLTQSTVGNTTDSLNAPSDALAQFKKLWHVS